MGKTSEGDKTLIENRKKMEMIGIKEIFPRISL